MRVYGRMCMYRGRHTAELQYRAKKRAVTPTPDNKTPHSPPHPNTRPQINLQPQTLQFWDPSPGARRPWGHGGGHFLKSAIRKHEQKHGSESKNSAAVEEQNPLDARTGVSVSTSNLTILNLRTWEVATGAARLLIEDWPSV